VSEIAHPDALVVGAGTAGIVLASRLSAEPGRRVLLLESGPGGADPALRGLDYLAGAHHSRFWGGGAVVERVAGQPPRPYRSGRGIGGSAAVNGMVAFPPTVHDVDAWAARGCPSWTAEAVQPTVDALAGQWITTTAAELGPLERALAAATETAGFGTFTPVALERVGTQRASVAERMLTPALDRPNLEVRAGLEVRRVVVEAGRAVGVELGDGAVLEAGCVVLTTGAIRTPALLVASGLIDVATSGRLSDHPSGTLTLRLRDDGPAHPIQTGGVVRWRTPSGATAEALPIGRVGDGLAALAVALMDPVSVGSIRVVDGHTQTRLAMLGAARDRVAMREAIDGALTLVAQPAVRSLVHDVVTGDTGAPAVSLREASELALDAWVADSGPYLHAACSCPLGASLDEWGRVPGVEGLRVADASALPELPPVAPNATVTVLAAHLAAHW